MNCRSILRAIFWSMTILLAAVVVGSGLAVALGATVLAVEPAEFRDRGAPMIAASSGPLRITILGTSLSSAGRYRWPDEVGSRLAELLDRPVEIVRIALPGATSEWGVDQVDRVRATNPDIVLIEFAVNDADTRHFIDVERSTNLHEQIITGLTAGGQGPTIVLLTMNPGTGPRAWMRPFLSRYYASYVNLAERYDTGLVDLYARWTALPCGGIDSEDGLHPTDGAASDVIVAPVTDALAMAAGSHA